MSDKFDILDSVDDVVDVLLLEHREQHRNGLQLGVIQEYVEDGAITVDEMVRRFEARLKSKLGIKDPNPVRLPDGKIECFTLVEDGERFCCGVCGCNVFCKPNDQNLDLYQCNSCKSKYQGRDE